MTRHLPESKVLTLLGGQVQATTSDLAAGDRLIERLAGDARKLGEEVEIDPPFAALSKQFRRLAARCEQRGIEIHAIAFRQLAGESGK